MSDVEPIDLLWGARDIARAIRRSTRQVNYLLDQGALPAQKVAGRWCASRNELVAHFAVSKREAA